METVTTLEASGMVVVTVKASGVVSVTVLEASSIVTVTVLEYSGTVTATVLDASGRVEGETELLGRNSGVSDDDVDDESPKEIDKLDEDRVVAVVQDVYKRVLTCASPILSSASLKK